MTAFHHVEVNVADLAVSEAWWGGLLGQLGFEPYQEWDEGVSFRASDGSYLVLVQTPSEDTEFDRRAVGMNHLAFTCSGRDEVDRLTSWCRERGTKVLYDDRHPHAGGPEHYAVFVEDPDGLKVEVVAADGASTTF